MQCSAIWYYEWQFQCYILHIAIYADSSAAGKRYDIGHMQQITACRYSVPDTVWTISPDPECNCLSQTLLHVYMEQKTILRSSNWSVSLDLKICLTDHLCVSCTCRLQTAIFSVQWSPPKKSIICQRRGFLRQKWGAVYMRWVINSLGLHLWHAAAAAAPVRWHIATPAAKSASLLWYVSVSLSSSLPCECVSLSSSLPCESVSVSSSLHCESRYISVSVSPSLSSEEDMRQRFIHIFE